MLLTSSRSVSHVLMFSSHVSSTSSIEVPLAVSLLTDVRLQSLIDVFYFEHHVFMKELLVNWGLKGTSGSLDDSLKLFTAMRERGIASHSWP